MLETPDTTTWTEAGLLLTGLAGAGFLVSWICTDVWHVARRTYVAILAVLTIVAWAAVAEATGTSISETIEHRWALGLVGAAVTGLVTGLALRRQVPGTRDLSGPALRAAAAWEGLVYGIAEGVLLSALPVLVVWQAAADAGWADAPAWAASLAASVVVIVAHHLGYWDYRGPQLGLAIVGCGLLTLGYLATGSLLAPALGHVVLHVAGITGGVVLPPHARPPAPADVGPGPARVSAGRPGAK